MCCSGGGIANLRLYLHGADCAFGASNFLCTRIHKVCQRIALCFYEDTLLDIHFERAVTDGKMPPKGDGGGGRPDFAGYWRQIKTENMDAFLKVR